METTATRETIDRLVQSGFALAKRLRDRHKAPDEFRRVSEDLEALCNSWSDDTYTLTYPLRLLTKCRSYVQERVEYHGHEGTTKSFRFRSDTLMKAYSYCDRAIREWEPELDVGREVFEIGELGSSGSVPLHYKGSNEQSLKTKLQFCKSSLSLGVTAFELAVFNHCEPEHTGIHRTLLLQALRASALETRILRRKIFVPYRSFRTLPQHLQDRPEEDYVYNTKKNPIRSVSSIGDYRSPLVSGPWVRPYLQETHRNGVPPVRGAVFDASDDGRDTGEILSVWTLNAITQNPPATPWIELAITRLPISQEAIRDLLRVDLKNVKSTFHQLSALNSIQQRFISEHASQRGTLRYVGVHEHKHIQSVFGDHLFESLLWIIERRDTQEEIQQETQRGVDPDEPQCRGDRSPVTTTDEADDVDDIEDLDEFSIENVEGFENPDSDQLEEFAQRAISLWVEICDNEDKTDSSQPSRMRRLAKLFRRS